MTRPWYRATSAPEDRLDHGFGVLEALQQHIWPVLGELGVRVSTGGNGHHPGAARPGTGDVARGVADHDDVVRAEARVTQPPALLDGHRDQIQTIPIVAA